MICDPCQKEFVITKDDETGTIYECPSCRRVIEERKPA